MRIYKKFLVPWGVSKPARRKLTKGFLFMTKEEYLGFGYYSTIPTKVLLNDSLPAKARLLYGLIGNLSNMRGYCFATNAYLAELTGWHERTITEMISALSKQKLIYKLEEITKTGIERRLFLSEAEGGGRRNDRGEVEESCEGEVEEMTHHNINNIILKDNSNTNAELKSSASQTHLFSKDSSDLNNANESTTSFKEEKKKKAKKEKDTPRPEYQQFVDIWCNRYPTIKLGSNPAVGGKMINSIIDQTFQQLNARGLDYSAESKIDFWNIFVNNLYKTWAHGQDLKVIASKYPSLIFELEHGKAKQNYSTRTSTERFIDSL